VSERERFEEWAKPNFEAWAFDAADDGTGYSSASLQVAWEAWQAALADEAGLVEAVTLFQEEWGAYQSGSGTGSHKRRWLRLERSVEGLFAALEGRGK